MEKHNEVEALVVVRDQMSFPDADITLKVKQDGDRLEETVLKQYFERDGHEFFGDLIATRFIRYYDMDFLGDGDDSDEEYKYIVDCDKCEVCKYAIGYNGSRHPMLTLVGRFKY